MVWADSEGCERASDLERFLHQASYNAYRTITSFPHA